MNIRNILIATIVAALLTAGAATVSAKDLVYGSYMPPKHNIHVYGLKPLFKKLGSEIPWKLVTGGQLYSAKATLKSVGNRVAEGGLVVPAYVQGPLKHAFISMDLMFAATDALVMNAAIMDTFVNDCPQCLDDYRRANTVLVSTYAIDGFVLLCRKPVTSLNDIKGKRIRTIGAMGRWAKALGGTPVSMTTGDMVEAISRGQLDCILGAMAWLKAYPIIDSVKSIFTLNKGAGTANLLVMNRDAWNELSLSQKKTLIRHMPRTVAKVMIEGYIGDYYRAEAQAKSKGIKIHSAGSDVDAVFKKFQSKEAAAVVKKATKRGATDPQGIVDDIIKNYAKWEKILGKMDRTNLESLSARYEKLLWERIYSKIDVTKL